MPRLNELNLTKSITLMSYGAPGVGKTDLAGSVGSRNLILTDLNGMVTLQNPSFRKRYPECNPMIEIIHPDSDPSQAKAYDQMATIINSYFEKHLADFDVITIDDVDFLRAMAMNKAVGINFAESRSQTKTKIGKNSMILPTMADFGTEMGLVEGFISNLASVCRIYGKHLIVNAHEKLIYEKNKQTKEDVLVKVVPHFTGKAAPEAIGDYFDLIFRITRIGKEPSWVKRFQCHPDDKVAAKDRFSVFKTNEDNLDWPKIVKRISDNLPQLEEPTSSNS